MRGEPNLYQTSNIQPKQLPYSFITQIGQPVSAPPVLKNDSISLSEAVDTNEELKINQAARLSPQFK
jgi:hypothetical protein